MAFYTVGKYKDRSKRILILQNDLFAKYKKAKEITDTNFCKISLSLIWIDRKGFSTDTPLLFKLGLILQRLLMYSCK